VNVIAFHHDLPLHPPKRLCSVERDHPSTFLRVALSPDMLNGALHGSKPMCEFHSVDAERARRQRLQIQAVLPAQWAQSSGHAADCRSRNSRRRS